MLTCPLSSSLLDHCYMTASPRQNSAATVASALQPFLVSLFLDCPARVGITCPNATAVDALSAAILRGDITWHVRDHRLAAS